MQPACTQVPPRAARSTSVTWAPSRAAVRAAATPPGPLPTTRSSVMSRGSSERAADVDNQGPAPSDARGRRTVDQQLALAVQGKRATGHIERYVLARLEHTALADHHVRRQARGQHRVDKPSRPTAKLEVQAA